MLVGSLFSFIAVLAFGVISNIRGKYLFFSSLGGGLSWFVYLLISNDLGKTSLFAFFLASIVAAAYSEIMARTLKAPVSTFVISSIIPLVPGGGMYETMFQAVQGHINDSLNIGLRTIAVAGTIAIAVFLVSSIAKFVALYRQKISAEKNTE